MAGRSSHSRTPASRQLREFGLLFGLGVPLLFGWLFPTLRGHALPLWPFVAGCPVLLLAVLAPASLLWPYRGWMALGHGLGWINGHLILGLVYLLVLQPIAVVLRLGGHDPLKRRFHAGPSYRESTAGHPVSMKRIF